MNLVDFAIGFAAGGVLMRLFDLWMEWRFWHP